MTVKTQTQRATKLTRESDQFRAFRKAARELGCEDNEEQFKEALRTVAKAKPPTEKTKNTSKSK